MIPLLFSPLGRIAGTIAIALLAWASFARHYENKGVSRVSAQIEKRVSEHAKVADHIRRDSGKLPANSLRDSYTRD